jgi:hypothetical protein
MPPERKTKFINPAKDRLEGDFKDFDFDELL